MNAVSTHVAGPAVRSSASGSSLPVPSGALLPALVLFATAFAGDLDAQSSVLGWGHQVFDSSWNRATDFVEVAAGHRHTLARRSDGSVIGWGDNRYGNGQCNAPALPPGLTYVQVDGGYAHSVALLSDGSMIA